MAALALTGVEQLEERLSDPSPGAVAAMSRLTGDLIFLGVGGKMGPTLARMARRAADAAGVSLRIFAAARFSDGRLEAQLRSQGIEAIRCDLLEPAQVQRLPDAANVVFMTGMKFGSTGQEALTWAMNAYLPALVCGRYARSRIVAFSTGNVYGLSPVQHGGSVESDSPQPVGEYAMSCLGRERMFEFFSRTHGIPMALLRLNYATETRYGVLVDIAQKVWTGQPIDLSMGNCNVIWQGDANAMTLQAFDQVAVPPTILNIAGPETLSIRRVAEEFGRLLERPVAFVHAEGADALLSNGQLGHRLFGYPRISVQQMLHWVAAWVRASGPTLNKPTHFESRDGRF